MSLFNNRPNAKKWRRGLDQYRNSNYSALDYITELHANFIDGVEFKY